MLEILKQALRPMDCLIFVAAVILFTQMNYAELTTIDIVYIATFAIWMVLLAIRIFLLARKG